MRGKLPLSQMLHVWYCVQALVTAARAEKSTTVQRSYAQAAGSVARYASEARVAKLVEEALAMYTTPGQFRPSAARCLVII